jgi:hypothetical protein
MREVHGRRDWQSLVVGAGIVVLSVAYFVGVELHDALTGLVAGLAFVFVSGSLAAIARRRAERRLAAVVAGSLAVHAVLDLSCLPGDWPVLARESLRAVVGSNAGMSVVLTAADGYVSIERRSSALTGKSTFTARLPLPSIRRIRVRRSRRTLNGCSLTFDLASGDELRVDIRVGSESAERVADLFRDAARTTPSDSSWARGGIEVTSSRPPERTTPSRAGLLMLVFLPPWGIAMVGLQHGPFAGATLSAGVVMAVALMVFRPWWMTPVLVGVMGLGGGAFVVDAARQGQPLRLGGTACCVLMATWMITRSSTADAPPSFGMGLP